MSIRLITGEELRPEDAGERDRMAFTIVGPFFEAVAHWVLSAPIEDVLLWRVVSLDIPPTEFPSGEARTVRWLIDRFTNTYIQEWAPSSLRAEWRYRRGFREGPLPDREMRARVVDFEKLAELVADLDCAPEGELMRVYIGATEALDLLSAGERSAATAVCNVVRLSEPESAFAQNNYGFCLLPDDPGEALSALLAAHRLGSTETVNIANRILALHWLGRNAAALEMADQALSNWDQLESRDSSYLWSFADGRDSTVLLERVCPRCYIKNLAIHIAEQEQDVIAVARYGIAGSAQ